MGRKARRKPKNLPAKLLEIRRQLGLTQSEMAGKLDLSTGPAKPISQYETGASEPDMITLLNYARLAGICVCVLVDDTLELPGKTKARHRCLVSPQSAMKKARLW